jgi:hypothetical protein
VNRMGMVPPFVIALLVREKPLVLVALAGTAVVVVAGRFGVGGLVVGGEPGLTVVDAIGTSEVGVKAVGGASGFEDFGSVDEVFAADVVVVVGSLGAGAVVAAVVGGVVWAAVVVGLTGATRGVGAGRRVTTDLGTFPAAMMVAAEAEATVNPAVIDARAIAAAIHRAAVGEVRCWVMPANLRTGSETSLGIREFFSATSSAFLEVGFLG